MHFPKTSKFPKKRSDPKTGIYLHALNLRNS